jgi:membrane fusion protein, copper/silver efflux system
MKNLIITSISTLVIAALFIQPSLAQDYSSHSHESEEVERFTDVPEEFQTNFTEVVEAYITGKDALLESDLEASIAGFEEFTNKLEAIGEHGLSGDGHMAWMDSYNQLTEHTNVFLNSDNIDSARHAFRALSLELTDAVKKFGVKGVVYQQYCPMALDSDGATWLSRNEQIQNPYTPDTMLGCGEVIERMKT